MATSVEAICNSALIKVGSKQITSISDANKRAELCTLMYPKVRDKVLKSHPWNFAIKRKSLSLYQSTFLDAAVNTSTDQINLVGHGQDTGYKCILSSTGTLPTGISENTHLYVIKVDNNHIRLATTLENANSGTYIDITAAVGGGTHTIRWVPAFKWEYAFNLPSDYLRALSTEYSDTEFAIEGQYLVTNSSEFLLKYISQITDVTQFSEDFDELK
jgi:hypothetical protein